jgi:hypothetical protein
VAHTAHVRIQQFKDTMEAISMDSALDDTLIVEVIGESLMLASFWHG